jgi:hypothetical protein
LTIVPAPGASEEQLSRAAPPLRKALGRADIVVVQEDRYRIAEGDAGAAVPVLERLVRADDLREDAHRRLMLCYARTAQRDRALRQYERLVEVLREELEAEPEQQSVALAERIRRAEVV